MFHYVSTTVLKLCDKECRVCEMGTIRKLNLLVKTYCWAAWFIMALKVPENKDDKGKRDDMNMGHLVFMQSLFASLFYLEMFSCDVTDNELSVVAGPLKTETQRLCCM